MTDLGTGKGFSRPTEAPQPSAPHLKEELESDTNQQKTGLELTPQHTCPALRFLHLVAVTPYKSSQQGMGEARGGRRKGWGSVTWHGVHGNIGLEWNGLLPVSRD